MLIKTKQKKKTLFYVELQISYFKQSALDKIIDEFKWPLD